MSKALQYGPNMTLAALLELQNKDTKRQINCHQVGEIVSFDPATQTAEVKVKMSFLLNGEIKEYPLLLDCPCIVLAGGQGSVTFPITAGDSCLVLFNDRDMDNWYSGGQTMPPRTERLHDFSDAIALVGLRNKQNQISGYFSQGTEIKYAGSTIKLENGKITITNGSSSIILDSTSSDKVILTNGSSVITMEGAFISLNGNVSVTGSFFVNGKNVGDNHIHSGVSTGSGNTGGVV